MHSFVVGIVLLFILQILFLDISGFVTVLAKNSYSSLNCETCMQPLFLVNKFDIKIKNNIYICKYYNLYNFVIELGKRLRLNLNVV